MSMTRGDGHAVIAQCLTDWFGATTMRRTSSIDGTSPLSLGEEETVGRCARAGRAGARGLRIIAHGEVDLVG